MTCRECEDTGTVKVMPYSSLRMACPDCALRKAREADARPASQAHTSVHEVDWTASMRDQILAALRAGPLKTFALRKALGIPAGDAARALSAELARMKRAGQVALVGDRTWGLAP